MLICVQCSHLFYSGRRGSIRTTFSPVTSEECLYSVCARLLTTEGSIKVYKDGGIINIFIDLYTHDKNLLDI